MSTFRHVCRVILLLCSSSAMAAPQIINPSFENDRYDRYPGYASNNGGITGWTFSGNAGLNPFWDDPETPSGAKHAFTDNGNIPHGKQVALLQNTSSLQQTVTGFEKGKRYRLRYWENGRAFNKSASIAHIEVRLDDEIIVSDHGVAPVEAAGSHALPYRVVESAIFQAPRDGAFELRFQATRSDGVTVFIDHLSLMEVTE